jgi:hypothetical protein
MPAPRRIILHQHILIRSVHNVCVILRCEKTDWAIMLVDDFTDVNVPLFDWFL